VEVDFYPAPGIYEEDFVCQVREIDRDGPVITSDRRLINAPLETIRDE